MSETFDVAIVGAGMAGLSCAVALRRAGLQIAVFEASDDVGGRVRTDEVDGFLLDRGFQVLLTAYPDARRLLDYRSLDLRPFHPGALIRRNGRFRRVADPWRAPAAAVRAILDGSVGPADALRMARLRSRLLGAPDPDRDTRAEPRSTAARLLAEGFTEGFVGSFLRPFLAGVFLDTDLDTSEDRFEHVFRTFASGDIAVPGGGMGEIPRQLARRLSHGTVRTATPVAAVAPDRVELTSGESVAARAVVVATDASEASRLLGTTAPPWRGVSCLYFSARRSPLRGPYLVLDGESSGPVNNLTVMSDVAPRYAPPDRALVSASVLDVPGDPDELEAAVRTQLRGWFGACVDSWEHLRTYRIPMGLPASSGPTATGPLRDRIHICGDHIEEPSLNGAIASGVRSARDVVAQLSPASRA